MADACECGNEPSGSMKYGEFLDSWSKYGGGEGCIRGFGAEA